MDGAAVPPWFFGEMRESGVKRQANDLPVRVSGAGQTTVGFNLTVACTLTVRMGSHGTQPSKPKNPVNLPTPAPYRRRSGRTFPTTRPGGHTALFFTNDEGLCP